MSRWISRKQKRRGIGLWAAIIAGLIIVTACVIAISIYRARYSSEEFKKNNHAGKRGQLSEPQTGNINVDSFFIELFSDLGLDFMSVAENSKLPVESIRKYRHLSARWPNAYPLIWFTQRFQNACQKSGWLRYGVIEFGGTDGLLAALVGIKDTLADIRIVPDERFLPRQSSICIVFDNFSLLKPNQASPIYDMNVPFGYILKPQHNLDKELAKRFKTSRGEYIIELPADKESWQSMTKAAKIVTATKSGKPAQKDFDKILDRFPLVDAVIISDDRGLDRDIVKGLQEALLRHRPKYIYLRNRPSYPDSLAYSGGLELLRPADLVDCRNLTATEIGQEISLKIARLGLQKRGMFVIESFPAGGQAISSIMGQLKKMNVKIVPPSKYMDSIDGL